MIGRCLGRRVWRARRVGRGFGERLVAVGQCAEHLICRYVQETEAGPAVGASEHQAPRCLQQVQRADDVRLQELFGAVD